MKTFAWSCKRGRAASVALAVIFIALCVPSSRAAQTSAILNDSDGDTYQIILKGAGAFTFAQTGGGSGPLASIALSGTDAGSALSIVVQRGTDASLNPDDRVAIGEITGAGSVRSIAAVKSDLVGAGIALGGGAGKIAVRDVAAGADITLGADDRIKALAVTARNVGAVAITSPAKTFNFTAASVTGGATFNVAAIGSLKTTAGSLEAEIAATGRIGAVSVTGGNFDGALVTPDTLGTFKVAKTRAGTGGAIVSSSFAAKSIGTISSAGDFQADVSAVGKIVGLFAVAGNFTGHVAAESVGSLSVKKSKTGAGGSITGSFIAAKKSITTLLLAGSLVDSFVMAGADFGVDGEPGGMGAEADSYSAGSLRTVVIGGDIIGSVIGAGLHPVDTNFRDLNDGTLGGRLSGITSFTVKGQIDPGNPAVKSLIGAGRLPATVSVNKVRFKPLTNLKFISRAVRQLPDAEMVASKIDPTQATPAAVQTAFLFSGNNAIQTGVAAGAIELRRMAVLRGRVVNRDGVAAPGVTVSVLGRPEFGSTFSREDGAWDLAVNGGGVLTVKYEATGLMPAQRQVDAEALDFGNVGDVAMVGADPLVTEIAFPSAAVQAHTASFSDDGDGARRALLIFPAGTTAGLRLQDNSFVAKSSLLVRATEFTVGPNGEKAMPAQLPPNSAFTYCVEYSADEAINANARGVEFNQNVFGYTDNFLDFNVGAAVPNGVFDRERGLWVAEENGIVLRIVGETGGAADVDITGDGNADTGAALAALGLTDMEREKLADLYAPGQELWRVPMLHFSARDYNPNYGAPPGARGPDAPPPRWHDFPPPREPEDPECCGEGGLGGGSSGGGFTGGSTGGATGGGYGGGGFDGTTGGDGGGTSTGGLYFRSEPISGGGGNLQINPTAQEVEKELPITGSTLALHYNSARVAGRKAVRQLAIPLTTATPPAGLIGVEARVEVAGRRFEQSFGPGANQTLDFEWDGRDAYGRAVPGRQIAKTTVSFLYEGFYTNTGRFGRSGDGLPIAGAGTGAPGRRPVAIERTFNTPIGEFDHRRVSVGGWTVSNHHTYDPLGQVLHLGDGTSRSAVGLNKNINTVAGGGSTQGLTADGSLATDADLRVFNGGDVAFAADGSMFFSESPGGPGRIRKVSPAGILSTIVEGSSPALGDGGPALTAGLSRPQGLAFGPDGSLYIVDSRPGDGDGSRIRKITADAGGNITPESIITTFAGGGALTQDNVPATQAALRLDQHPTGYGIAVGADGSVYFPDLFNFGRVRKVGTDGLIVTVAGAGNVNPPNFGDGGRATNARVIDPTGVALDPQGNLYITAESLVRKVSPDGIITTVAGSPNSVGDFNADGIPATAAGVSPFDIVAHADGSFTFTESGNNPSVNYRVSHVDAQGIIRTAAGTRSVFGFSGDGGPPKRALLLIQGGMLGLSPDGRLHIVDNGNGRIRAIGSTLPSFTAGAIDIPGESGRELYRFDEFGRHERTVDTLTGATLATFAYDADGQLASATDAFGNKTTIQRAASGAPTAILAPDGQKTTLTIDASGTLASVRSPGGAAWQLANGEGGLLTSLTSPTGQADVLSYDANGRLAGAAGADAASVALARTEIPAGFFVTATNALGATNKQQVEQLANGDILRTTTDAANLVRTTRTREDGTFTLTDSDATVETATRGPDPRFGLLAPVTKARTFTTPGGKVVSEAVTRAATLADAQDPLSLTAWSETWTANGKASTVSYDPASRVFSLTSALGRAATFSVDEKGLPVSAQAPGRAPASFTHDAKGRPLTITKGAGATARTTSASYNAAGFVATITDPLGRATAFSHNANGDVTQFTLPGNRTVKFTRDALGQPLTVTPPGKTAHTLGFTPFGAVASYLPPGAGAEPTTYSYRADRQLASITRPGGQTVAFAYDAAGRPSTRATAQGTTTLSYDAVTGDLASIAANGGNGLVFTYDGSERLSETWSGEVAGIVSRTIDNDLRTATQSVNGAHTVAFTYDDDGDIIGAGGLAVTRDPATGFITAITLGVIAESYGYNEFGEATSVAVTSNGAPVFSQQLTRDALGRIVQRVETISGVTTTLGYEYDLEGRLSKEMFNGDVTAIFRYDANGNRTAANAVTATYDEQDRLLQRNVINQAVTYAYTAAGDLLSRNAGGEITQYSYDALGNLRSATTPGAQIDYVIDAGSRRIGRKTGGALTQGFLYDGTLRVVAELDGAGAVASRFVHATRTNVPDYMIRDGVIYRLVTDPVGSVRLVLNATDGTVAQRINYDARGNVMISSTNPGFQPFGFAGGLYDPATKLVRFGARDYDPETGRWTAKDPLLFAGGDTNLYAYCGNDPVNDLDPTGLRSGGGKVCKPRKKQPRKRDDDKIYFIPPTPGDHHRPDPARDFQELLKRFFNLGRGVIGPATTGSAGYTAPLLGTLGGATAGGVALGQFDSYLLTRPAQQMLDFNSRGPGGRLQQ